MQVNLPRSIEHPFNHHQNQEKEQNDDLRNRESLQLQLERACRLALNDCKLSEEEEVEDENENEHSETWSEIVLAWFDSLYIVLH